MEIGMEYWMNNACVKMSHGNPHRMNTIQFLLPLKQKKNNLRIIYFGGNWHGILDEQCVCKNVPWQSSSYEHDSILTAAETKKKTTLE